MYTFVSHESACEALRLLSTGKTPVRDLPRWPHDVRRLPTAAACVSGQRDFRGSSAVSRLRDLGVTGRPVDLMVRTQESRSSGREARFHVWRGLLPSGSLLRLDDELFVSGPELAVIQLCSAQGKLDALLDAHAQAVRAETELLDGLGLDERPVYDHPLHWERIRRLVAAVTVACEFSGTYRLRHGEKGAVFGARPLMSMESLARACADVGPSQGTRRARRVSELALDGSASPMETSLALMLSLPVDFGGFGLERPLLNCPLDVSGERGGVSDRDAVVPDILWFGQRVILEYDSAEFHAARGSARVEKDAARANVLTALGYRVLRATPQTVRSLADVTLLARQIARLLDVELVATTPVQDLRRRRLFSLLMPNTRERG